MLEINSEHSSGIIRGYWDLLNKSSQRKWRNVSIVHRSMASRRWVPFDSPWIDRWRVWASRYSFHLEEWSIEDISSRIWFLPPATINPVLQWVDVWLFSTISLLRCRNSSRASGEIIDTGIIQTYAAIRSRSTGTSGDRSAGAVAGELQWIVRLSQRTRSPARQWTSLPMVWPWRMIGWLSETGMKSFSLVVTSVSSVKWRCVSG